MRVPREDLRVPDAEADIYLVGLGIGGFERRTVEAHNIMSRCALIIHLSAFDEALRANYGADVHDLNHLYASGDDPSATYAAIVDVVLRAHKDFRRFGPIALVVYGHPLWLVNSSWELLRAGTKGGPRVKVVPGTSFLDQIIGDLGIRIDVCSQMHESTLFFRESVIPDIRYPLVLSQFGDFESPNLRPTGDPVARLQPLVQRLKDLYPPERLTCLILSPWRGDMEPQVNRVTVRDLGTALPSTHTGMSLVVHGERE